MKTKILVIYNPISGSKLGMDVKKIILETLEKKGFEHEFFETVKAEKQPLEPFAKKDYKKIIVSGGDGTVAEVAAFLIKHKIKTPLVIIPQGSANILAKALKIPLLPGRALKAGLKKEGKTLDAMKVNNKHYGLIAVGVGYDALVMQQTTRKMKRFWGGLAYLWTILKTIFAYRGKPYKINVDGERHTVYAKALMTFNILPLGKSQLAKHLMGNKVIADDGILNTAVLNPRPIPDRLLLKRGIKAFQVKKITIQQRKSSRFHIDGDLYKAKTIQIEVVKEAIRICC